MLQWSPVATYPGPDTANMWHTPPLILISITQRQHVSRVHAQPLSRVQIFATPGTVAHQAPLSKEFSRQETGVDCHALYQGIFPTQWSNCVCPSPALAGGFFTTKPPGNPHIPLHRWQNWASERLRGLLTLVLLSYACRMWIWTTITWRQDPHFRVNQPCLYPYFKHWPAPHLDLHIKINLIKINPSRSLGAEVI